MKEKKTNTNKMGGWEHCTYCSKKRAGINEEYKLWEQIAENNKTYNSHGKQL